MTTPPPNTSRRFFFVLLLLLAALPSVESFTSANPTWLSSPFFRAGSQQVIAVLTGNASTPKYTFTYSSALTGLPNIAYGIKRYRGNDTMRQEYFEIRKTGLTSSTFSVEIQIYGVTNLWVLEVAYIAVEPTFPHHLNSFDNVPLNYSSGLITNISTATATLTSFEQTINYKTQATGRMFTTFATPLTSNKMVLFITSLWIAGTAASVAKIHVTPTILNSTHYKWVATVFKNAKVTKLQFSQIIFNEDDVLASGKYFIVYEEWISDLNGGFKSIPVEFQDNFIMAITDFEATDASCGFEYQWEYQNTTAFGVGILKSWTKNNFCGFSWIRTSIFYMKTWRCDPPYNYFNLTTNLCQDMCSDEFIADTLNYTCTASPCQLVCTQCINGTDGATSTCTDCNATLGFYLLNGKCVCESGFATVGSECVEVCGDGLLFNLECDDGNTLNGDGCSSTCEVESHFYCVGGSNTTASVCHEVCGDGRVFILPCDDGNLANGDGCSSTCQVQPHYFCYGGSANSSSLCEEICGDGFLIYYECDDGNLLDGDGCSANCSIETGFNCLGSPSVCSEICGDGTIFYGACDDANILSGDGCSTNCSVEAGYVCSGGNSTAPSICVELCGDGKVFTVQCDDGNLVNGDGCSSICTIESGFSCSGGSTNSSSICVDICGDGRLFTLACDDGNTISGDGCSATCQIETGYQCSGGSHFSKSVCNEICGDGKVFVLPCDDGNLINGDGCSSTCQIETGYSCASGTTTTPSICKDICGDGKLFTLACDDGNLVNGDGCSSTCTIETGYKCSGGNSITASTCTQICGDGKVFVLPCDDGNVLNGDGCSSTCQIETGYSCASGTTTTPSICKDICGDGKVFTLPCDDGNLINGDGCSSTCQIQTGYTCSGGSPSTKSLCSQICGEGKVFVLPCDDGNLLNGDGCSSTCQIETYYNCVNGTNSSPSVCYQICGDGKVINAQCDDGNVLNGDGCSSTCQIETAYTCVNSATLPSVCSEICGDGILANHACDDGNLVDGDGCSSTCTVEDGYGCQGGSLTSASVCNYKITPTFELVSYYKNPTKNEFSIDLKITDLTPAILANIANYLTFNFPYQTVSISVDPVTGIVHLDFTYAESLNSQDQLTISYKGKLVSQSLTLPETTDNNLTLKLYDDGFYFTYKALNDVMRVFALIVAIGGGLLFLVSSRLMAVEMFFVFQFTFCGLMTLKKLESLMEPFKLLWVVNSYNQLSDTSADLPPRVSVVYYKGEFLSDFNLDFLLYFLPMVLGGCLLVISRISRSTKVGEWGRRLLKEWQLSAMLFCHFQLAFATVLALQFGSPLPAVVLGLPLTILFAAFALIFAFRPQHFGEYKSFFKPETANQNFYAAVVLYRLFLAFGMAALSETVGGAVLGAIFSIFWSIILIWRRPYLANTRPIANSIFVTAISILLAYTRAQLDESSLTFATYLPLIVAFLLFSALAMNLYFIVKHQVVRLKDSKQEETMDQKIRNEDSEKRFEQPSQTKLKSKSASPEKKKKPKAERKQKATLQVEDTKIYLQDDIEKPNAKFNQFTG